MSNEIRLELAMEHELPYLMEKMKEAFAPAAKEHFGEDTDMSGPPPEQFDRAFSDPDRKVYILLQNGKKVGAAVLMINEETQHNKVDLLFIFHEYQSKGLGFDAWKAIELAFPETKMWELDTPYFEKRNINFYVNKCGFHIVEYFNDFHPDPHRPPLPPDMPEMKDDGFFRFEKIIT